jgi:D-apiose dehydrogenase
MATDQTRNLARAGPVSARPARGAGGVPAVCFSGKAGRHGKRVGDQSPAGPRGFERPGQPGEGIGRAKGDAKRMRELRFAVIGAGFWAPYQIAGWQEVPGARCVAIYNRTAAKARAVAQARGIPAVYEDPEDMLEREKPDFVDVITDGATHAKFVKLAARFKVPVISQKPLANTLAEAEEMVRICREAGVPFYVHENWRWQGQVRELQKVLESAEIGVPFRARIFLVSGFPVFNTEPALREQEEFVLKDMGPHLLDVARFLFGEADRLYCQIHRVQKDIKGEDAATVMLHMGGGTTVTVDLGFPGNFLEKDVFNQTLIFVEGDKGTAELDRDYWVRVTTQSGTRARRYPPVWRPWMHHSYITSHSSIPACNAHLLGALRGEVKGETTGEDNLKTMRLTFAAYDSARTGQVIRLAEGGGECGCRRPVTLPSMKE